MGAPSEFTNALVIEFTESVEFVDYETDGMTDSYENVFLIFKLKVGGEHGMTVAQQVYWDQSRADPLAPFGIRHSIIYDDEAEGLDQARQLFSTFIYSRISKMFNNSMGGRK